MSRRGSTFDVVTPAEECSDFDDVLEVDLEVSDDVSKSVFDASR